MTDKCPTCKGWCCANHNEKFGPSIHYQHSWTKVHFCPDCDSGLVWTTSAKSAPKPVWTAEQERAAVVAWLREYEGHSSLASLFALMADTIERGEHRREVGT
jgi:hypothetical protein